MVSPRRTLLPGEERSWDRLFHHFEVEKAIADRIKASNREERQQIYRTMYDELFAQVPDHPRLRHRASPEQQAWQNRSRLRILKRFLRPDATVVEFAPGDCAFAWELCSHVQNVIGIDISDQSGGLREPPRNFELIVYNGYDLDLGEGTVDVVFSDQLIEHFHPEETEHHFRLIHRMLKRGGSYVYRTPHAMNGPHDISRYFTEVACGFHLKEWTYTETEELLGRIGYSSWSGCLEIPKIVLWLPFLYFTTLEPTLARLPVRLRRILAARLLPSLVVRAVK